MGSLPHPVKRCFVGSKITDWGDMKSASQYTRRRKPGATLAKCGVMIEIYCQRFRCDDKLRQPPPTSRTAAPMDPTIRTIDGRPKTEHDSGPNRE
jgi:hypothetical protein